MKKILLLLATPVLAGLLAFRPANDPLPIGAALPQPTVKMKDVGGKEISFADAKKKNGLLVMFSCNTCPVVGKYKSRTLEIARYALSRNIGVILLNSNEGARDDGESMTDMQAYAKEEGYDFSYVLDPSSNMADLFGATRTPELFLFNKDNTLVYHGAIDDNPNDAAKVTRQHAREAINELTDGKDISTKQTRSVGCTIKRLN